VREVLTLGVPTTRFALLFMSPILLFAAAKDWKTGKVLDSATAKTYVQSGATTSTTITAPGNSVSEEFAYVIEDTCAQSGFTNVHSAVINAVSGRHAVGVCR
jgi:hypothetical protein